MIKPSKFPCNTLSLELEQYPSNTCDTAVLCPLCGQQATPKIYPIYLPQKLEIPYPGKDSLLLIFNPTQVGYPRDWKNLNTFDERLYIECTIHITPLVMFCLL